MPTAEEIVSEWEIEGKIDRTNLESEIIRNVSLHSKYLRYLILEKKELGIIKSRLERLKYIREEWLMGTLPEEDLKSLGWDKRGANPPLRADVEKHLSALPDVVKLTQIYAAQDIKIFVITNILKEVNDRRWNIKNLIDNRKFEAGIGG